ncbi:MAG: O-antigen ligase family protein [Chloroflexi bacterium]|nr:O-antigen ligase family protein [Chloroflexota bacterium]
MELIWPFPLIAVGVFKIQGPVLAGIAVVLALSPWLVRWLVFGQPTRRTYIGGALGLLAISALAGVWASYDPALSWPLFFTLLGSVSLFFAIVNTSVPPRYIAGGLVVVAALLAFYFVGQYGYFPYPGETGRLAALGRMTGSFLPNFVFFIPHPNAAAAFMESVLLLSLVLVWQARGIERGAWGVATVIIAYGLLISGSRGAWVGLVGASALWGMLRIPNRNLRLAIGGLGLVGAGLGVYAITWLALTGSSLPGLASALATAHSRLTLYRNSLYLLKDYLYTGIGLGNTFAWTYSRYQLLIQYQFLTYSHNLFLSVGLGLGLLGLVALVWLLVSFYWFVVRVEVQRDLAPRTLLLFRAAWLGVTTTFGHGLTDAPQLADSGWTMPILFVVLGLVIAIGRPVLIERDDEEIDEPVMTTRRTWLVFSGVVVVLLVITAAFWRPLLSAWYANLGAIHQTRAELVSDLDDSARDAAMRLAVNDFARALNLNPTQAVANRRLGLIALDRDNFDTAVAYLEQAYSQEPGNQATLKALGLAYVWVGRLDVAEPLLHQIDDQAELIEELGNWSNWRESRGQTKLSEYASEMAQRLSGESP